MTTRRSHSSQPGNGRTSAFRMAADGHPVEVVRSARRRRTVSAYRDGDRTVILLPAQMSAAEEHQWVDAMVAKLAAKDARRKPSDDDLARRAELLSARYFSGKARPTSICWVGTMRSRWGSCTPVDGTIRISDRLQGAPGWVLNYVVVHELAHLLVADHSQSFWDLVAYPKSELARGYLLGVAAVADSRAQPLDDDIE